MTTATQRLRAIQELCKAQGKPTHGQAFLSVAESLNESLRGRETPAYHEVKRIIQRGREYENTTRL